MAERTKAFLRNPALLTWARSSLGLSLADAAKRLKVPVATLSGWEQGLERPSIAQLRKVADAYKRPLSVFFRSVPPAEPALPTDFRKGTEGGLKPPSPSLLLQIRRVRRLRRIAAELNAALGLDVPEVPAAGGPQSAAALAESVRCRLAVSIEEQMSWPDPYAAIRAWRNALENTGTFVFQFSHVSPKEARGFSITATDWPAIAVNAADAPSARVFSIFHELAHLVLRQSGLCDLENPDKDRADARRTETFCNQFAAALLLPADVFEEREHQLRPEFPDASVRARELASTFKVSADVVFIRGIALGVMSQDMYDYYRSTVTIRPTHPGGGNYYRNLTVNLGAGFIRLVLSAYHQDLISHRDVAEYLNTKVPDLSKIEAAALRD